MAGANGSRIAPAELALAGKFSPSIHQLFPDALPCTPKQKVTADGRQASSHRHVPTAFLLRSLLRLFCFSSSSDHQPVSLSLQIIGQDSDQKQLLGRTAIHTSEDPRQDFGRAENALESEKGRKGQVKVCSPDCREKREMKKR